MIDPQTETLVSLAEAAKSVQLADAKPHLSTVWRWCRKGIGGVRLEYLRVGRRIVTSREALGRFFQAVTAQDVPLAQTEQTKHSKRPPRTSSQREREINRAARRLEQAGL